MPSNDVTPVVSFPRYIQLLNQHVAIRGATVSCFQRTSFNGSLENVVQWKGTSEQLIGTGVLSKKQRIPKTKARAWSGYLNTWGQIRNEGNGGYVVTFEFPVPNSIETTGDIEVIKFDDETFFHGEQTQLLELGIIQESQIPGDLTDKRRSSITGYIKNERFWRSTRLLDGSILFEQDKENIRKQRSEASGHESQDKWREHLELMCSVFRVMITYPADAKSGGQFLLPATDLEKIEEALQSIEWRIQAADIIYRSGAKQSQPKNEHMASIKDTDFKRFLDGLGLGG